MKAMNRSKSNRRLRSTMYKDLSNIEFNATMGELKYIYADVVLKGSRYRNERSSVRQSGTLI